MSEIESRQNNTIDESVYAEQVRLLYTALPVSVAANFIAGILIVGIQWTAVQPGVLLTWLFVFEAIILLRGLLYIKYRQTSSIEDYHPWGKAFNFGAGMAGLLWGAAGVVMFPAGNDLYQMTLIFCLLGMSAGAVSSHSFLKTPPYVFVILTLTPLFFRFLYEASSLSFLLAVTLILCISYLLSAAKRNCDATVNNIRLRFDAIEKEKEVEKSRQLAEHANRAKSEFLSRMSHELRTPLNAIVGFGQLLEEGDISESDKQSVSHIVKAGRHLTDMINEILDIARIESGRQELSPEPVLIRDVLADTWGLIQPLAAERNIELLAAIPEACHAFVYVDRQRFKQVLLNLMSNAIKYNHDNGHVSLFCATQHDGAIRVSVKDTGAGIEADKLIRVFDPFERLGAERSKVEGSGIGLALSKALIDAMGGRLGVDSEPGVGSTFWVEFPLLDHSIITKTESEEHTEQKRTHQTEQNKTGTIIYIEDNIANLRLIEATLRSRKDIELIPAMQGELGYDLALKHQPDVILLDLDLPDLPGQEVLARLKSHSATQKIPVIIISADATQKQIDRLLADGAYAYLTKPFNIKELLQTIEKAMNHE